MDFKKIAIALIVASILIGCVSATNLTDFKIHDSLKEVLSTDDFVIYANEQSDSGIGIYKLVDNVEDNDTDDDDKIDNLVHDDGDEYITADEDMNITVNSDNTANFTDADHGTVGVSEVINHNGEKHVVVFWAKNSSDRDIANLTVAIAHFNKDNNVTPIAF